MADSGLGLSGAKSFGPIFQISTKDPVLREACYRVSYS